MDDTSTGRRRGAEPRRTGSVRARGVLCTSRVGDSLMEDSVAMTTIFRQFLRLFRGTDPLRELLEMFAEMLLDSRWMYDEVLNIYAGSKEPETVEKELFARDRKINATEREIRRRLVEYLAINQNPNVGACLVLMSVAKDAERLGDYVKNLFNIAEHAQHAEASNPELDLQLHQLRSRALPLFDATRAAFLSPEESLAQHSLESAQRLAKESEKLVWEIAERTDITPKAAVLHALSARHVKRIVSHLANIATAAIQPVDWLDYTEKSKPPDAPADDG
ncbi:MAG: hypothetical protein GF355_13095 [Candidatus Eisenbacteria bacterium]|nr:hypothetical protein [Candidatus Eisenbacteria bacterium]